MIEVDAREARAIAIAAQGLGGARSGGDRAALLAMIDRLGVVQIDSVNVLARSHYLPAWSRLGAYDPAELDRLSHEGPRAVFEYWGHEASLLPVALQPLLRWRMARAGEQAWTRVRNMRRRRLFVSRVLDEVRERGPLRAGELETKEKKRTGWWEWSEVKVAIEWLFWSGQVTSARRRGFERMYDLPERVLPEAIIAAPTPREADAIKGLVERGARALGIATEVDLRDYFRIKPAPARTAIAALVDEGVLEPVRVEGWKKPAYRHRDVVAPAAIDPVRATLLSPFDSLVWCRERTERVFGMRYRLEIYTPQPQRVFGYYVLPILLGDALVGRVDLKADREAKVLRVQAAHAEPRAPRATAAAVVAELDRMAAWLGLDGIAIERRGDLAPKLLSAVPRRRQQARRR
ncbi:MAG: crosslink repair DNA glycosylase YcaQ family protein [Kofleriaceae bacterium]